MALSTSTFSNLGGAASDLFAGMGATANASLKAKGLNLNAASTRLNAQGLRIKAQGDLAEASEYDLAGNLAGENARYTEMSTNIQEMQSERQLMKAQGSTAADVAGAGFGASGSALDIMAENAAQGALSKAVLGQQGLITEAGYKEQAQSYNTMSTAARMAASGEQDVANQTDVIANQTDELAQQTIEAGKTQATGDYISAGLKIAGAVAGVVLAPATGGLSLGLTAAALSSGGNTLGESG